MWRVTLVPSQISRRHNRSFVWTEALCYRLVPSPYLFVLQRRWKTGEKWCQGRGAGGEGRKKSRVAPRFSCGLPLMKCVLVKTASGATGNESAYAIWIGSFGIDDEDGSEKVTFKMNSRFFKLYHAYSNSLKMSNVDKFPWSWFLRDHTQVLKEKEKFVFSYLRPPQNVKLGFFTP